MLTQDTVMRPSHAVSAYWLIAKNKNGGTEMLTIERGGEEALPVFSFEEEAGMFLSLGASEAGWSLRRTTAGELVSMLMGPYSGVEFVSLDPMPELVRRGMADLVSLSRERFMHRLVRKVDPLVS